MDELRPGSLVEAGQRGVIGVHEPSSWQIGVTAWRFRPPAKRFLVAEVDTDLRSALLPAGLREATTVRSYHWAPQGEPATTPPARGSLAGPAAELIAARGEARISFDYARGQGSYRAPLDSRRWFYGMLDGHRDPVVAAAECVIERGLRACVRPGEWVY